MKKFILGAMICLFSLAAQAEVQPPQAVAVVNTYQMVREADFYQAVYAQLGVQGRNSLASFWAVLRREVPRPLHIKIYNSDRLRNLFGEAGFSSLLQVLQDLGEGTLVEFL